jgi:hypothetical protein
MTIWFSVTTIARHPREKGSYTMEQDKAAQLQGQGKAQLVLTLDLATFNLNVDGAVPGFECALAMLRMAADEYKRLVDNEWAKLHGGRIVPSDVLPFRFGVGGRS